MILILGSSCHALKSVFVNNNSPASNRASRNKEVKFLENIEVKPGTVVTSKHKTSTGKKLQNKYKYSDKITTNMDEVNWLQFKYSIVADVELETLNNIPLLKKMDEWYGTRYCIGGESKECVDCSGFTGNIYRDLFNFSLPRTAQDQFGICDRIDVDNLQEGDLVFFHTSGRNVSHVGIFLANNKFVHSSTTEGVTISDLNDNYWQQRFISGGRVKKGS